MSWYVLLCGRGRAMLDARHQSNIQVVYVYRLYDMVCLCLAAGAREEGGERLRGRRVERGRETREGRRRGARGV